MRFEDLDFLSECNLISNAFISLLEGDNSFSSISISLIIVVLQHLQVSSSLELLKFFGS